jgi:hypothetical protein
VRTPRCGCSGARTTSYSPAARSRTRAPAIPGRAFRTLLDEHRDRLREFVATQPVQTNEVRRCWTLLPGLLAAAEGEVDLVELGPSGGLNLIFDHWR